MYNLRQVKKKENVGKMKLRDHFGVNGDGVIVERLGPPDYTDPDEFSYDDEIRGKWLARQQNRQKNAKPDYDPDVYKEERLRRHTFRFLGYPELIFGGCGFKLFHSFEEKFGEKLFESPKDTMLLKASFSVVSLSSFVNVRNEERRLFTCSGTVIEVTAHSTMIVTSAYLVARVSGVGNLSLAENLKIKVRVGEEEPCHASLLGCCLHYNLAFIMVEKRCHVRPMQLSGKEYLVNGDEVFALGRHYLSGDCMAASGRTIVKDNHFDCLELLFSSCKITKCGVGGPLVDSHGDLCGVNFYDEKDTPYLPTCLVSKCLDHVKSCGKVIHPFLGWKLRALALLETPRLEEIYDKHRLSDGFVVDKVEDQSTVQLWGILEGDIIIEFRGQPAVCLPQFAAALLDESKHLKHHRRVGFTFEVMILRGDVLKYLSIYVNEKRQHNFNRWPLPKVDWEEIQISVARKYPVYNLIGESWTYI